MAVDYRLRQHWYTKQGRVPPEKVEAIQRMLHRYGQRPGETATEYRERLDRQNAECRAEADRRMREEDDID
jgi:hypothetical protein